MLSNGSVTDENCQKTDFEGNSKQNEKQEILDSDDQRPMSGATTIFVPDTLWLVLDMSCVSFVDSTGGKMLAELRKELQDVNVNLCLAAPSEKVLKQLDQCGTLDILPKEVLFHSVHDAVTILARPYALTPTASPRESSVTQC
ncbi:prestin-like [Penaeus japonicus]|uniref:prestin-like n=1 Tax=Penaeus japonicus TaxID=27405 RepID=UPI001C71258E|nr:prestin-like [Penaeus japonicus]